MLVNRKDSELHNILLFCLLTRLRSEEAYCLLADNIVSKGNFGRFVRVAPNDSRQLKSKAAQREVALHSILEHLLDTCLSTKGRRFPDNDRGQGGKVVCLPQVATPGTQRHGIPQHP